MSVMCQLQYYIAKHHFYSKTLPYEKHLSESRVFWIITQACLPASPELTSRAVTVPQFPVRFGSVFAQKTAVSFWF